MVSKYGIALLLGVAAGAVYVGVAGSFDPLKTMTVAGGVLALTLLAALGKDLCRHPSNLGDLQEERPTLIGALMFTAIFTAYQVYETFTSPPSAPSKRQQIWIHNSWGVEGRCAKPLKIAPGATEMQLDIETGGEHFTRRIISPPTDNEVRTDGGTFELRGDGSMASTVEGYKGVKFTRCDP